MSKIEIFWLFLWAVPPSHDTSLNAEQLKMRSVSLHCPEMTMLSYSEKSTESESKQLEMFLMILLSNSIPVTYSNKNYILPAF